MLSSVTSSVSNWFGTKPQDSSETSESDPDKSTSNKNSPDDNKDDASNSTQEKEHSDFDDVSAKALNTAKEWGSYLYSFGKAATEQVTKTAKQFKDVVEEKTILGDFSKEQEKFVQEKHQKEKYSEAALPPWVGYNEEEAMKQQILALSMDKRNFLRNPPSGVQFQFDYDAVYPVALATLPEDPNLQKMRFDLVPKQINEETFWRNYFYRVSLIKQSTQLTSLAQQTGTAENTSSKSSSQHSSDTENGNKDSSSSEYDKLSDVMEAPRTESKGNRSSSNAAGEGNNILPWLQNYLDKGKSQARSQQEPEDLPTGSPPENEFVSDTFQANINEEDLKREMEQLGMKEEKKEAPSAAEDDIPEWEKELQAELQEYEVVDDGKAMDDAELEQEILQQIEEEAKRS